MAEVRPPKENLHYSSMYKLMHLFFQTLLSLDIRRIICLCAANLLFYLEDFLKQICKTV